MTTTGKLIKYQQVVIFQSAVASCPTFLFLSLKSVLDSLDLVRTHSSALSTPWWRMWWLFSSQPSLQPSPLPSTSTFLFIKILLGTMMASGAFTSTWTLACWTLFLNLFIKQYQAKSHIFTTFAVIRTLYQQTREKLTTFINLFSLWLSWFTSLLCVK